MIFSLHIRMSEENTLKTDFKRKQSGKKHMRQTERLEAFDQRHLNIHGSKWLWKRSATPRQVFKNTNPSQVKMYFRDQSPLSRSLCLCTVTAYSDTLWRLKRSEPKTARADFWGMRVQSGPYIGMEETTKQYRRDMALQESVSVLL